MTSYIALLRKDPASDFGVEFPDFPGCVTAGRSLEEARVMAGEALSFHVAGMIEDQDPIPAPSSLDEVMAEPEHRDCVVMLVTLQVRPAKPVRVNVLLPADLLADIDRATRNRSRFLTEAARAKLRDTA